MHYKWYKDSRMVVKSYDKECENIIRMTQEYYDEYIAIRKHHVGKLYLFNSDITSLGELESVDGSLNLAHSKLLTSLGNLDHVGGTLDLGYTNVTSLGKLDYVENDIYLAGTELTSLGNLKSVGGVIYCRSETPNYELLMDSEFSDLVRMTDRCPF